MTPLASAVRRAPAPATALPVPLLAAVAAAAAVAAVTAPAQSAPSDAPGVVVAGAERRDVTPSFFYVSRVEAVETVELVARVEGFLERRDFREGGHVEKGDLLFLIEQAPYRIAVEQREADLAGARATGVLLPGQFVTVIVRQKQPVSAVVIPQAAVQKDQQGHFVLLVDRADRAVVRRVVLGEQAGSNFIWERCIWFSSCQWGKLCLIGTIRGAIREHG